MTLNAAGIEVPQGSDAFNPDGDMRELAGSLNSRVVIPTPNATGRTALGSAIATRPLLVLQEDTREVWEGSGSSWSPWGLRAYTYEARLSAVALVGVSSTSNVLSLTLPADAPAGVYAIDSDVISRSDAAAATYVRVQWAGGLLPGNADAMDNPGGVDVARTVRHTVTHTAGGAATILLGLQINGGTVAWNRAKPGTTLRATWLGRA